MFVSCTLNLTRMQPKIGFALIKLDLENCPLLRTQVFLDRQESTDGKTAWLAPLGSPQEVDNCL